jgi:hypothetical protein
MLGGIAGLKCKMVKIAGQRLWVLFTGAQKTTKFACNLCKNGWEKPCMAFVEVVEESEIYNFRIYALIHFYSKIWRKTLLNRATWIFVRWNAMLSGTGRLTPARMSRARPLRSPLGSHADTSKRPLVRAWWDPLMPNRPSDPLLSRHAPHAHGTAAPTDLRRPAYGVVVVPLPCRAPYRVPSPWSARNALPPPRARL